MNTLTPRQVGLRWLGYLRSLLGTQMKHANPSRVAARHLASLDNAPLTPLYLKKLLAYMERENTAEDSFYRGSWFQAIEYVQRVQKAHESGWLGGYPLTVKDLVSQIEERELLPKELLPLLRKAVPHPRVPKVEPVEVLQAKVDATYAEIASIVPGSLNLHGELLPQHLKWLQDILKAWKVLKAKYPVPWKIAQKEMRILLLNTRTNATAEASWLLKKMHINVKPSFGVGTLIHELGHAFEGLQSDTYDIMAGNIAYGNPPYSHAYFKDRGSEDFAECFRQFFGERGMLKSKAPEKYADMARRIAAL